MFLSLNVSHWGTKSSKFTLHSTEEHKSTSSSLEFITLKIDYITSEEKIKVTLRSNYQVLVSCMNTTLEFQTGSL